MLKLLRMVGTTMRGPKPELLQCVCCFHLISPVFSCLLSSYYYFGKGSPVIKGSVGGRSPEGYYVGRTLNKPLIFFLCTLENLIHRLKRRQNTRYPVGLAFPGQGVETCLGVGPKREGYRRLATVESRRRYA